MVPLGYGLTTSGIGQAAIEGAAFMSRPTEGLGVHSFTYTGPLSDAVHFALRLEQPTFSICVLGVLVLLGTLAGAFAAAQVRHEFKVQPWASPSHLAPQIAGAAMTGSDAVIALGCTLCHATSGIRALSLGWVFGLIAMFAGAALVLRLESGPLVRSRSSVAKNLSLSSPYSFNPEPLLCSSRSPWRGP